MDHKTRHDFESRLLKRLSGQLAVLQDQNNREQIVDWYVGQLLTTPECGHLHDFFQNPSNRQQFIKDFLSFQPIAELLSDLATEDIVINGLQPIYIHHSQKGFVSTHKQFKSQEELDLFIQKLLIFSGRTHLKKIMNLELPNLEGRVNIAHSAFGAQITITKAKISPLSIIDLIRAGSLTHEVAAQLWLYVEGMSIRPANMMIAGGPGVGKTTLLNALFSFIPDSDHVVVIEDTLELNTFLDESTSRLESDDDLNLTDLVKNSLRMRPERIVIGEVRGEEARDMITACNIGKYCMGTIHALTSREAIMRLQNEPMNVPEVLVNLIDVFIVIKRYHVNDKIFRVVDEVSETSGMEQVKILLSHVFKYDYDSRKIRQVNPSTIYRDRLAHQAGLTSRDILKELLLRTYILEELDRRNLVNMKEIAAFCRAYTKDPNKACTSLGLDRDKLLNSKK